MMNTKKFITIGLMSMLILTGCANQQVSTSSELIASTTTPTTLPTETPTVNEPPIADKEAEALVAKEAESKEPDEKQKDQEAIKNIISLGDLIGKKQTDVINILGKADESKNLEDTDILLADYYKQTVLEQVVKLEIVYNDDKGEVNFVGMTCVKTDHTEEFVEAFSAELTAQFGESSIEKITNIRGTRRRQWQNGMLTYVLSYVDDTVMFNIYPTDQ